MRIGIIAPSSKVPALEFEMGVEKIRAAGFDVVVHPSCYSGYLFFSGTDDERAQAFYEFARDPKIDVLWSARGGYGSARLLPMLEKLSRRKAPSRRKLFVGFSDSTALIEFVHRRWGWETLHAAMPGLRKFCVLSAEEWDSLVAYIGGDIDPIRAPWAQAELKFIGRAPKVAIRGKMIGGNLSVLTSLVGTRYALRARDRIVFLEDVDENLYRVDRMVQQLLASGSLKGARAVVLGNFMGCKDLVPQVLKSKPAAADYERMIQSPRPEELEPLRATMFPDDVLGQVFGEITKHLKVPVARWLPVGHGPEKAPLPLNAEYQLTPKGRLELVKWRWLASRKK